MFRQLHNLTSLVKKKKRIGRGGSRGGTSGRGHKGQKARTGHSRNRITFEGGQMPLIRRIPKRGFKNTLFATTYAIINIGTLERCFNSGDTVSQETLLQKGLLKKTNVLIKVLGNGILSKKLIVYADALSQTATDAIKKSGGEVHLTQEK